MDIREFNFELPEKFIGQTPVSPRDHSKLLYVNKQTAELKDYHFFDLPKLLKKGDVLVFNNSKVIPARITFKWNEKDAEILLLKPIGEYEWQIIGKPGKMLKIGTKIIIRPDVEVEVLSDNNDGTRLMRFNLNKKDLALFLDNYGEMPLPPYIAKTLKDTERYQTIYSKIAGSVAAPTAGLHFTQELLQKLISKGVQIEFVTLNVGLGTFLPIKTKIVEEHRMHSEIFSLTPEAAKHLNLAKKQKKRIIAVGTTSARVLESSFKSGFGFVAQKAETNIFIKPGYKWKAVDGIITNFHLPKSTLLLLVAALIGKNKLLKVYEYAKRHRYRFYSFGDAMLIE